MPLRNDDLPPHLRRPVQEPRPLIELPLVDDGPERWREGDVEQQERKPPSEPYMRRETGGASPASAESVIAAEAAEAARGLRGAAL